MEKIEVLFFDELEQPEEVIRQCDACLDNVFFENNFALKLNESYLLTPFSRVEVSSNRFVIFTTTALAMVNQKAIEFLTQFSQGKIPNSLDTLTQKFIEYGFLHPVQNKEKKIVERIDKLSSWIHLTDSCNLRCHYCFLPHDPTFLSIEMGKKIVDSLVKTAQENDLKKLKLKYAGGEPLQNKKVLKALHHYALEQKEMEISASILTNGTLLDRDFLLWIKEHKIKLIISLDNIESKNPQRIYKEGEDSAQDVMKNIELALNEGIKPFISITLTSETIDSLNALLSWILEKNLFFSINFYKGKSAVNEGKLIQKMLEAFKLIENNFPQQSLLNTLVDMSNFSDPHLKSCSVGENYLIFNTNGEISQCPMTMDEPIASVDSSAILKKIQNPLNKLKNFRVDEQEECKTCQWRYWCGGGCAVVNSYNNGKSPYCEVYKALFPEVLRLEGLRLLKQSPESVLPDPRVENS